MKFKWYQVRQYTLGMAFSTTFLSPVFFFLNKWKTQPTPPPEQETACFYK